MSGDARARQNGSGERGNKLSEAKIWAPARGTNNLSGKIGLTTTGTQDYFITRADMQGGPHACMQPIKTAQ
jgi:hypothetical protein